MGMRMASTGMVHAVMSDDGDLMGWGGDELGGNGAFVNPYLQGGGGGGRGGYAGGVAGMGMVLPNRMYNMPAANGVEEGPVMAPDPCMSNEEMLKEVAEAERLRKSLDVWHAKHHASLTHLRNQIQNSDVSHAAAIAAANMRIQALEENNVALRDAALTSDDKMSACNKALDETSGKYKKYKKEYTALQVAYFALVEKYNTLNAENNNLPAGMAGPATV